MPTLQNIDKRAFVILAGLLVIALQFLSLNMLNPLFEGVSPGITDTGPYQWFLTFFVLAVPSIICRLSLERFEDRFADARTTLIWGGVFAMTVIAINVGMYEAASFIVTGRLQTPPLFMPQTGVAIFIDLVVLVPVAEEVLFRGYILKVLVEKNSVFAAVAVTSLLAVLVHSPRYPSFELSYFALKFIQCIILCMAYIKGRLGASIAVHMVNNLTVLVSL